MEGVRGESQKGTRDGEGAPTPLVGKGVPEEQARAILDQIVNFLPGAAHIVAKTRQHYNCPDISKGTGDGAAEEGGEVAAVET